MKPFHLFSPIPRLALGLLVGIPIIPIQAQETDSIAPLPALTLNGGPNPDYESSLKGLIEHVPESGRKAFFRRLRRQQRELKGRIQEMEYNLDSSISLNKALQKDGSGLAPQAQSLIKAQTESIARYRSMARAIVQARRTGHPQQCQTYPQDAQAVVPTRPACFQCWTGASPRSRPFEARESNRPGVQGGLLSTWRQHSAKKESQPLGKARITELACLPHR